MKVILTEKVKALGGVGETVNVSEGYARNFLIPKRWAVLADATNKKQQAHHDKMLAKKIAAEKTEAEEVAKKLKGLTLEIVKKVGGTGKLFGTVTTSELATLLATKGVELERRVLVLDKAIKTLGSYTVSAKLFKGVDAEFKVNVVIDPKQAEEIKAKVAAAEAKAAEKKAKADAGETEEEVVEEKVELTEEQKLKEEANRILRM